MTNPCRDCKKRYNTPNINSETNHKFTNFEHIILGTQFLTNEIKIFILLDSVGVKIDKYPAWHTCFYP